MAIAFVVAGVASPLLLRGAIGFFHPKEGVLMQAVSLVGSTEVLYWVGRHISLPIYEFLTFSLWSNTVAFFALWITVVVLVVGVVWFRVRRYAGI